MAIRERVAAAATSSQSHLIVGVLLLSFVIWVTLRGNFGKYLTFLGFGTPAPAPSPQQQATGAAGGLLGSAIPGGLLQSLGGSGGGLGGITSPIATPPFVPSN